MSDMAKVAPPQEVIFHVWANHLYTMYVYEPFYASKKALIDPLPHQIDAVSAIIGMNPVRVLLADEVGLGKTIVTGMVLSELLERGRISNALIVAPKAIVNQWIRELREKFGIEFVEITRENLHNVPKLAIISLDLAKKEDVLDLLSNIKWDMLVIDEAHRLTVHPKGGRVEYTLNYKMAEKLAQVIPNVVLLTATPHSGIRVDFAYRLRLLDLGLFEEPDEVTEERLQTATQRLMIRRTKEEVRSIDGKPLFPPRHTIRLPVYLSDEEKAFYDAVANYVRKYYGRAGKNRAVQLALIVLQRRVSSSIESGVKSLEKRLSRLTEVLTKHLKIPEPRPELVEEYLEAVEELDEEKIEKIEEELASLTSARTLSELREEVEELKDILEHGKSLLNKPDTKLQKVLEIIRTETNQKNKVIVFTEFKDTLNYLVRALTREGYVVAYIHGGMGFEERRNQEEVLRGLAQVMVATDAAGEGLNLQVANVVVNYEVPWNPNRIEQRMGRVHRYGQKKSVRIYNVMLENTIEGRVLDKLFEKVEDIRRYLGEKVYDVIGSILTENDVRRLIIEGEPIELVLNTMDERAYRLIEEYGLLIARHIRPRKVPEDRPLPLIEFLTSWADANGGKVYFLDNAVQLDVMGRVVTISRANPWSHEFVRQLIEGFRNKAPVVGILGDVNGKGGTIYIYRLCVEGSGGSLWEGLRAYHVDASGHVEKLPVSYIYHNLRSVEATLPDISVVEDPRARTEAFKDTIAKVNELKAEEEEIVSILESETRMKYEAKIRTLRQLGKIAHETITKLLKECEGEIEKLKERVEAIRAKEPELIAVIHLIPTRPDLDEELKREVELAGMKAVIEFEKKRIGEKYCEIKDVSHLNLGYDIVSRDLRTGEERCIEVKSFRATGDPELTENEYETAKFLASKYWLYVVEDALTKPKIRTINDPVHTSTIIKVSKESYKVVKVLENRYIVKLRSVGDTHTPS